jgi:hypothetical protein
MQYFAYGSNCDPFVMERPGFSSIAALVQEAVARGLIAK